MLVRSKTPLSSFLDFDPDLPCESGTHCAGKVSEAVKNPERYLAIVVADLSVGHQNFNIFLSAGINAYVPEGRGSVLFPAAEGGMWVGGSGQRRQDGGGGAHVLRCFCGGPPSRMEEMGGGLRAS